METVGIHALGGRAAYTSCIFDAGQTNNKKILGVWYEKVNKLLLGKLPALPRDEEGGRCTRVAMWAIPAARSLPLLHFKFVCQPAGGWKIRTVRYSRA